MDDFFAVSPRVNRRRLPGDAVLSCRWFDLVAQCRRSAALRATILESKPHLVVSFIDTTNISVLIALRGTGIPVIATEHSDPRLHGIGWRWSLLRRVFYPGAAAVTVLNDSIREWALSLWPRWKAITIPNAVEKPLISRQPAQPRWLGSRNLLAIGRLAPEKGFDLLIQAFANLAERFPEWHLTIIGEGSERAALEGQIARLELSERVHLLGSSKDPWSVLPCVDLFVVSSRYEGFSLVLVEAMSAGLAVVSFDCPSGPAEIIRDGEDGILVNAQNREALADALAGLMANETERRRLGRNARISAERYSPERVMTQWRDLIERVVADSRGRNLRFRRKAIR
jgi:glycosyltransferase involved in cell wall biosynthesis